MWSACALLCIALILGTDLPRAIWHSHTDSIVLFTDAVATEHTPKAIITKTNSRNIIVRCSRLEAIFLQKMLWLYSIERQGVLFQLVFLLITPQTAPHYRSTTLWTLLLLWFYLFLPCSVSTYLYTTLLSFICFFFIHSSSSIYAYLFFLCYTLFFLPFFSVRFFFTPCYLLFPISLFPP